MYEKFIKIIIMCTAGAILLNERNIDMIFIHEIIGVFLYHGEVKKWLVCNIHFDRQIQLL
jgi:hypothetical protein